MTEVRHVSPFLTICGQRFDVRRFVDSITVGAFFTEKQIGSKILPLPGIPEDVTIESQDREKIFQLLGHFAYLRFTPTPNNDQGSKIAYELVSKHQPEEMVLVGKTNDRVGLHKMIVPKVLLEQPGQLDPDWMEIATFALIDSINQYAE